MLHLRYPRYALDKIKHIVVHSVENRAATLSIINMKTKAELAPCSSIKSNSGFMAVNVA